MSAKNRKTFNRPSNVPSYNFGFESFSGPKTKKISPAIAASGLSDRNLQECFKNMSKNKNQKKQSLEKLIEMIPTIQSSDEFQKLTDPCFIVFNDLVSEYDVDVRLALIRMMTLILARLKEHYKNILTENAGYIFSNVLLLVCDTDKSVSQKASILLNDYFSTKEKRTAMISKLRSDIANRITQLLEELQNPNWPNLSEPEINENWGRLASMSAVLSANLLAACNFNKTLFETLTLPPVLQWLTVSNSQFNQRATPQMRSGAYLYMNTLANANLMEITAEKINEFISAEKSILAQMKLMKLILTLLDKNQIQPSQIQNQIINSLWNYYEPQKIDLKSVLMKIKDLNFLEKCLEKASASKDVSLGIALFNCVMEAGGDDLPVKDLLEIFKKALDRNSNQFYSKIKLDLFTKLKDENETHEILNNAKESRAVEYLLLLDDNELIKYLKGIKTIKPEILNQIITSKGVIPIRSVWPHLKDIPLEQSDVLETVKFLLLFIHSDEVDYIIDNMNNCLTPLLNSWNGDYEPFKTPKILDYAENILNENLSLIEVFSKIFPNNEKLIKIANEITIEQLTNENQFDPDIIKYFPPSNELIDTILFSNAIEILQPTDKLLISFLTKRIIELLPTSNQVRLAKIASQLIQTVELDPIELSVLPDENPIFCYEYWKNIGFDNMSPPEFCHMIQCYLLKKSPFFYSFLYSQNIDWRLIPKELFNYIQKHPDLAKVAQQNNLLAALASISYINNFTFSNFSTINGLTLFALPTLKPPSITDTNQNIDLIDDYLSKTIRCEWNMETPTFPKDNELRNTISYMQHYLPVIEDFSQFTKTALQYIESNDPFEFFLALRILSMIYEANKPFDVLDTLNKILKQVEKYYPLPAVVENELCNAFRISKFLTPNQFDIFINSAIPYISSKYSPIVSKIIVPVIQFFNQWDIVDSGFNNQLDLSNIECWNLIAESLKEMPYKRRIESIPQFSKQLPSILNEIKMESSEFLMLISLFPKSTKQWYANLPNSKKHPLYAYMENGGTNIVFENISNIVQRLKKLENTIINIDKRNKTITAVYMEDSNSVPVKLSLIFPNVYPLEQVNVECEFGNEGNACAQKVFAEAVGNQSIEAGIITWHQFIVFRLKESEPCTICYSYLSDEMKKPTIPCPTCGQKFHGKCLQRWFLKSLKPTCPYCGSAWVEKKSNKKK